MLARVKKSGCSALTRRCPHRLSWPGAVLVLLLPRVLSAQEGATVSGRAVDEADNRPLAFATVVLEDGDTAEALSGGLAGDDGRFLLRGLEPGTYIVRVSFPGYRPAEARLLVSDLNPVYDLGELRLVRVVSVEELTVTADAIRTAGADTQVFRIDEGAAQSTGTLLDALKNLPGVTVDQEGRVRLRGSDQVAILIDGRQSSLTGFGSQRGLDNVAAANVEAIEIINNPSARFDAAGMAGIINVIYKQTRRTGFSGEAGLAYGVGRFSKQRPDLPTDIGSYSNNQKLIPNVSLNYNTQSIRAFLQSQVLLQNDLPNNEFTTRFYDDGRVIRSQVPENREQQHYTVRAGTDILADGSNTFTVSGIYDFETHTDRAEVPFILDSTGERERFWFWREKEDTGFANANLDWKRTFTTPGHELGVNLQYIRGWEDEAYFLNEMSTVREGTDMTHLVAKENTLPLSIDYVRPLANGRLELGTKLQRRWLPITYTVDPGVQSVIYPGLGDWSDWDEDIIAAYGNLVRATERYTLEAGLRVEQTWVTYTIPEDNTYYQGSDSYDYFELFPNVRFSYLFGEGFGLTAAYNRRIDRPGEPELRIFPKYDDPELLKVGNPYLRPQLTDAFELGVRQSWSGGSVRAAGYLRDISDAFLRLYALDESNQNYDIINKIYHNVGNSTQTGVEVIGEHQMLEAWRLTGSVNWFVNDIEAFETLLLFPTERPFFLPASTRSTWDFTVNNFFRLPGAAEVQASFVYYAGRNVPQGWERARSSMDLALSWPIRDGRTEFILTWTDLFNDFAIQREIDGDGFDALYENLLETQVATLGVRVRF